MLKKVSFWRNFVSCVPDADQVPEFREKRSIITTILNKCIGPCYDVIPIDANENTGVFSSSKFAWYTGSVLWPMIVGNQTRNNYDEQAVENLRKGPFEFQIEQKCRISGVGKGVAVGRILCAFKILP